VTRNETSQPSRRPLERHDRLAGSHRDAGRASPRVVAFTVPRVAVVTHRSKLTHPSSFFLPRDKKTIFTTVSPRSRRIGWLFKFAGLLGFAAVLSPAFFRVAWSYYTDDRITRDVRYGPNPRNRLDLFLPRGCAFFGQRVVDAEGAAVSKNSANQSRPVIVFVTGGMWIIGYKAWGALLAMTLMRRGFIVASLDYRNFPQGTVGDMAADVGAGIGWVRRRAASLGGDPRKVFVVGQSAGAHLAAVALLRQTEWQRSEYPGYGTASSSSVGAPAPGAWSPKQLAGFVGVSGVYSPDDPSLVEHFDRKGLYREVFYAIMEAGFSGSRAFEALPRSSPCAIVREFESKEPGVVAETMPPTLLCHGQADTSAPPSESAKFAEALRKCGVSRVLEKYYPGKTHTDPFVTDPILGGRDALAEDISKFVRGVDGEDGVRAFAEGETSPPLMPRFLVSVARTMVPF
jgi:prenylcysteine alpha-carboxyl methylesterase